MEQYIHTEDGLDLWSEAFGSPSDPPVLLLMGAMNQGIFWPDTFCQQFADLGFYVVRYDHRDTGQSSTVDFTAAPYDLDRMAHDARSIMLAYQMTRPVLVGLSMGGYIAQLVAAYWPDDVSRLVLLSTSADHRPYLAGCFGYTATVGMSLPGPAPALIETMRSIALNPAFTLGQIIDNLIRGWQATYAGARPFPRTAMMQTVRRSISRALDQRASLNHAFAVGASPDRLALVRRIETPTLVIHGEHDPVLPLPHGEYLAANMPNARLLTFDMGHSFMHVWDEEVLSAIVSFVRESDVA